MIHIIWSILLFVYAPLQYNFIQWLDLILTIFDWLVFFTNMFFNVFYVCYSFSKTFNAWYNILELYMCIFVMVKYKSNIGVISADVPRMISILLKFIFAAVWIIIQALILKWQYLITYINYCFLTPICTVWQWCLFFCVPVYTESS